MSSRADAGAPQELLPAAAPDWQKARAAIESALRGHYPGLVGILERRTGGNRALARDVLQDAIVTALSKLDAASLSRPDVVAGFVFRTAVFHLQNQRRRSRVEAAFSGTSVEECAADPRATPVEQSRLAEISVLVRRALEGLANARDRELIVRFYLDEHDKTDICASMGLSDLQFNRVIHRARDRLRALMERTGLHSWDLLALASITLMVLG